MILPPLNGTCHQSNFFIYAACDTTYFDEFGPAFIHSIRRNTNADIHIHLFNPTINQLSFCQKQNVSVTWEVVSSELFLTAANRWRNAPLTEPEKNHYERTQNAMVKGKDNNILERMQKTYYACSRFIRLSELFNSTPVLAVDIDAVIRKPIPTLTADYDFYVHHIAGKKARYLAGGFWLNVNANCKRFLGEYANQLISSFNQDYIYWGLDQDVLDSIIPKFNYGQLPMSYIDWNMKSDSIIWTAKGTRKELALFVNEQKQYSRA